MGVAETPDPLARGGAHSLSPPRLPPGVYFSPTREESVALLDRWIAGGKEVPADARGFVARADIYSDSPDALRRRHPPASARAGQRIWWFLCETRFQSPGAAAKRPDRKVGTGGCWRVDRSKAEGGGVRTYFVFFRGPSRKDKTPWVAHEFTSAKDDGAGKKGVPALYMLYVTPRATDDELRGVYGEDAVTVGPDGNKKPVRAAVPAGYINAVVALLSPGSVGDLGQERVEASSQAPPPPQTACLLHHDGQQGQNSTGAASPACLLHHDGQQGQNSTGGASPACLLHHDGQQGQNSTGAASRACLLHHDGQQGQNSAGAASPACLLHHDGQQGPNSTGAASPACLLHHDGQQGQNSTGAASPADLPGQYQQRRRHGRCFMGAAMPAAAFGQSQQQPAKTVEGESLEVV